MNCGNARRQRRGAAVVAMVLAMVLMSLVMIGMVMGGARDQDLTVQRINTIRAFYASEAGTNMGIREVILNTDADGDGTIGSISNDGNPANNPTFGTASVYVSTSQPEQGQIKLTSVGSSGAATRDIDSILKADNGQFGFGTPFATGQQSVAGKQIGTKVTIPVDAIVLSMSVYLNGPSPKVTRFGLYNDSGGEPNALLAQSYTEPVGGDSAHFHWFTLFLPSTSITTGDYWLAVAYENTSMAYAYDSVGGQTRYNNNDAVSNGFNSPWGTSTASNTRRINMYVTAATETTGSVDFSGTGSYDNNDPNSLGKFRDVANPTKIQRGNDISANATHYAALNFTAAAGLVADCLTVYDTTPSTAEQTDFEGSVRVFGDVLVTGTSNSRWIGFTALHNEVAGQNGLALMLRDNGNSDQLQIFRMPSTGDVSGATALASSATFNSISENKWYRLVMDITISGSNVTVDGRVFSHMTASNPTSAVNTTPLKTISYTTTLASLTGLQTTGEAGICFDTSDPASRGSVTNFEIDSGIGTSTSNGLTAWAEVKPY